MRPERHLPSLDGIRGIAVLLVVLYHFGYLECGWVGVQIFFVLSGFLITNILVQQKPLPLGRYLKRFYWRRILRIFPLYYGYLALIGAAFLITGVPAFMGELWGYFAAYVYNFARVQPHDPGGLFFVHFWSLAIEEQFYLFWPITVFLLSGRKLQRVILGILLLGPVLRVVAALWAGQSGDSAYVGRVVNVVTTSHLDAFAWGGAVAVFRLESVKKPLLVCVGAVGVTLAAGLAHQAILALQGTPLPWTSLGFPNHPIQNGQHVWGYTLINAASAAVILCSVRGVAVSRSLSWRWLVHVGKISYGVYVFHLPLLRFFQKSIVFEPASPAGFALFWVYLAVVLVVSELSFRFYESRFLALKNRV